MKYRRAEMDARMVAEKLTMLGFASLTPTYAG
jgi:hypothetical protein